MRHDLFFRVLWLRRLLWRCRFLYEVWPRGRLTTGQTTPTLAMPTTQRSNTPKPFPELTHKPRCDACEHASESCQQGPLSAATPAHVHAGAAWSKDRPCGCIRRVQVHDPFIQSSENT
jgi:hypothetical protein